MVRLVEVEVTHVQRRLREENQTADILRAQGAARALEKLLKYLTEALPVSD